ncbi:MAG: ATP phosphoribosyltransferase [Alphaproteobacteria bacterium]|nr:ATP phosphoribosyltransferase [Alphaproteobacteria bacterium]
MPKTIIALPKGRILKEAEPFLLHTGIRPEEAFFDEDSRLLRFKTNDPDVELIRVRSFDVATFVAFGAAQLGICGNDVLAEFDYSEIYAPLDLGIGKCRMSAAAPVGYTTDDLARAGHVRVATKYPNITKKYYQSKGIQAECIKLSGAMELAPTIGLCHRIVDVVSSGATLKANGLVEIESMMDISARLIINRTAFKTRTAEMTAWLDKFKGALNDLNA